MKAILHGHIDTQVAAVVGVWDPLLPAHRNLFQQLTKSARTNNANSMVIIIEPDPGILIWGEETRPLYDDLNVRIQLILEWGIDAAMVLHFTKSDLGATAEDFFNVIEEQVSLSEFWLGANQTLGNGPKGSLETVQLLAQEKKLRLRILPELGVTEIGYQVRWFLLTGELKQATMLVGRPPLRTRPESERLSFAWREGVYSTTPMGSLAELKAPESQTSIKLQLVSGDKGLYYLKWPDRKYEYLAFIEGPGDAMTTTYNEFKCGVNYERLLAIAGKSASLYERMSRSYIPYSKHIDDEQCSNHLKHWCINVANGDYNVLELRLAQDGYNLSTIRPVLGPVRLATEELPPPWIHILASCMKAAKDYPLNLGANPQHFLADSEPLAFEELFVPFIHVARTELSRTTGKAYEQLSEAAHADFERSLLRRISALAQETVQLEYTVYKAQRLTPLDRLFWNPLSDTAQKFFEEFARNILADGMIAFFEEYPVLGRLIANTIGLWVETVTEFLFRLERDRRELSSVFNSTEDIGTITKVVTDISDNHNGGRSVYVLTFESGHKLVYKPKSIDLEQAYAQFQQWFNEYGILLSFKPLRVIPRYEYGWVEFACHQPCNSLQEIERYFRRCGMHLCLVYLLEGTDFHSENLIASGEYPQLIDLETLMHHYFQATEDVISPSARALAEQRIWRSVLRTHFLPNWVVDKDGNSRDLGGLSSEYQFQNGDYSASIDIGNSVPDSDNLWREGNLPYTLEGTRVTAGDYVDELESGFEEMYEFLMAHRELLLAAKSPLLTFASQKVRFVLRPTETYSNLLQRTLHPQFLRDGLARSLEIDALSRIFVQDGVKTHYWPILHAEHQALEQLDVPYFTAMAGETSLHISENIEVADIFHVPSYINVIDNLRNLNKSDLEIQKQFIRLSFYGHDIQDQAVLSSHQPSQPISVEQTDLIKSDELILEAVRIAEHLAKSAIYAPDGSTTWIALQFHPNVKRYQLRPIGYDLYGGSVGIALFFASLSRVSGLAEYRNMGLASIESLRHILPSTGRRFAHLMGIGGFAGMGSIVYALSCMASLLNDERCARDACNAALSVTGDLVSSDTRYDLMDGCTGFLLSLLHLHKVGASYGLSTEEMERVLSLAVKCGNHLLDHRVASVAGPRAWPTVEGKLFSGFSHGAAGIAYALLRLYAATGDPKYQVAAREAIAYEQSIYVPEKGNWPHFEAEQGEQQFLTQWCHGAPGIALGRVAALSIEDLPSIRVEIDLALATTVSVGFVTADYLCCGNLGRAIILTEAAQQLARPNLEMSARQLVTEVVKLAKERANKYTLNWNVAQPARNPGFMRGLSGIGYSLLKMSANGDVLPSVLSLT